MDCSKSHKTTCSGNNLTPNSWKKLQATTANTIRHQLCISQTGAETQPVGTFGPSPFYNQWPKAHATDVTMWGLVLLEGAILHAVLFWGGRTHNCQCTGPPPCWKGKTNEVNINGVCWDGDSSKQISWKNYNSGEGQQRIRESDMLTAFAGIKT